MITTAEPRRRAGQRIASAVWGLLVAGAGGLLIAAFSGYDIDLELAAIITLGAVGGWLLLAGMLRGLGRQRDVRAATTPVVEEPMRATPPSDDAPDDSTEGSDDTDASLEDAGEASGDGPGADDQPKG
ncbi:hypothetical protein [uncultured Demequina sp.]|uniref:hypothetical protein n=1 Tax=uncultured Demequina sp. TaxID=693499 RepID=UPI0025CECC9C|nr:hypothetical protein [uncultured Demequina sp.]